MMWPGSGITTIKHIETGGLASSMNRAFTLVELLAMIAIIAVLAALLLPGLSGAKSSALATACKNSLRQFGVALSLYSHDHGSYLPHGYRPPNFPTAPGSPVTFVDTYGWPGYLLPYLSASKDVFRCPARGLEFDWSTNRTPRGYEFPFNLSSVQTPWSYGYNGFNIKQARSGFFSDGGYGLSPTPYGGLTTTLVSKPADMIAIGDSDGNSSGDGMISLMRPAFGLPPDFPPGDVHKKGANIVFCDGHVEWQKQTKWIDLTSEAARRWHYDNQPHGDWWYRGGP